MKLLPIPLIAKRGNWQRFSARQSRKNFASTEKRIFARDDYTCQYCGFKADKYQVIVNRNHNYSPKHNKSSNMVTACKLCAQCMLLDGIGTDANSGGTIIYLPEIAQADLNHFCRVLFVSMLRDSPYKGRLQTTYLSLQDRKHVVEDIFGPDSFEPYTFGQGIIDSNVGAKQLRHPLLQQLRLLPDKKFFKKEVDYWQATVFDKIPV